MERLSHPRLPFRLDHLRQANRAAALRLLRHHRQLSRAELARRTGLSEAAVSRIIAELMEEGLLVERGSGHATGGRPGVRLELNEARFRAVGVDIQNWETRVSLGTIRGRILGTQRFRTPATPLEALEQITATVERSCAGLNGRVVGVGVSARGLVNSRTGVAELGSHPAWLRVGIRDYLLNRIRRPVFVENNVRAAAVAEYIYGSPDVQGARCLLLLMVGEGIGMSIVLDGKLYHGPQMAAGEIGQMVIADRGGAARHDRPGSLEALASDLATCERYRLLTGARPHPASSSAGEEVRRICLAAIEGDAAARQALTETAAYLGIGIANAVWALDAEAVIIDGALTEGWPLVSPAIRGQFPEGPQFPNFRNLVLRPSALAGEASLIGAVTLPFAPLFSSEGGVL